MRASAPLVALFFVLVHLAPLISAQSVSLNLRRGLPAPTALARADYDLTHAIRSAHPNPNTNSNGKAGVESPLDSADAKVTPNAYDKGRSRRRKLDSQGMKESEMPLTNAERLRLGLPLKTPGSMQVKNGGEEEEVLQETVAKGKENGGVLVAEQP